MRRQPKHIRQETKVQKEHRLNKKAAKLNKREPVPGREQQEKQKPTLLESKDQKVESFR
jgi:hypothetical protein